MLKNIKAKDLIEFFLIAVGVMALIVIAGILEAAPLSIALFLAAGLATILWMTWWILVCVQRNNEAKRSTMWMVQNGMWVALDGSGRTMPIRKVAPKLFDQDEAAISHLDFNKEQA